MRVRLTALTVLYCIIGDRGYAKPARSVQENLRYIQSYTVVYIYVYVFVYMFATVELTPVNLI